MATNRIRFALAPRRSQLVAGTWKPEGTLESALRLIHGRRRESPSRADKKNVATHKKGKRHSLERLEIYLSGEWEEAMF